MIINIKWKGRTHNYNNVVYNIVNPDAVWYKNRLGSRLHADEYSTSYLIAYLFYYLPIPNVALKYYGQVYSI